MASDAKSLIGQWRREREDRERADQSRRPWHVAPTGSDWQDHPVEPDGFCEAHIDAASRGEVPYGGYIERPGE